MRMYKAEVKPPSESDAVTTVLQYYFDYWTSDQKLMIHIGHDSKTEEVQQRSNKYLEPNFQTDQIEIITSAGSASEF